MRLTKEDEARLQSVMGGGAPAAQPAPPSRFGCLSCCGTGGADYDKSSSLKVEIVYEPIEH